MAQVIAPFKIVGTIDDLNFYILENEKNIVREKGECGITSEQFYANPVFDPIRKQGREFGHAANKAKTFRRLFHPFFERAKDGAFAGRVNKLLLEILTEDQTNPIGNRTITEGLKTQYGRDLIVNFQGNRLKPLSEIMPEKWNWNPEKHEVKLEEINVATDIRWPGKATHVHFVAATCHWNEETDTFETCFSEEIILEKEEPTQTITLKTEAPNHPGLKITAILIAFSEYYRRRFKPLKRGLNTTTIIDVTE
ncbi:hypothetical protein [Flavobacterium orientale]|uniref:Uncharacterized protein n=1 Tax=Flavobacterium orientale TaxID=1756020 RepID=A0A917DED5_9FLAO|nr:hypothetical protein [Flavobacterium orientale]GGD30156.1 hypothetical protein GCM10011343_20450 [Flavobacterium orientale]